jgi:hypothetical protein
MTQSSALKGSLSFASSGPRFSVCSIKQSPPGLMQDIQALSQASGAYEWSNALLYMNYCVDPFGLYLMKVSLNGVGKV